MKIYDFARQDLIEMPMIKENAAFDYLLDNNAITQLENIPFTCHKLSITNNKISFINSKLSNEIQLKILDLSYNRIISLLGFNNLINLEELNLSNNYISDEQLDYLSNLSMLKYLNLSNNNIKQDSFIHLLSSLGSIEKINLSNNNIESVTFNQKCQSLVQIELDANKIISFIITNNQMLPKLKYLSLCGNKLENCDSLNNLPNIEYIILNENEIKTCEFISTTQLKYLHFKSNMVTSFTIHESLSQIEFIELSYNNLSLFTIEGCHPFLKNILLDNNKLMNIEFPNRNISFKNVELIDVSYNLLNKTSFLELFPSLQRLNLSFNQISSLKELVKILRNFSQLQELNLIENDFNRNYYNVDVITQELFNNLEDYLKHPLVGGTNGQGISYYRNCLIVNIDSLAFLDMIAITEREKERAFKENEQNPEPLLRKSNIKEKHKSVSNYNNVMNSAFYQSNVCSKSFNNSMVKENDNTKAFSKSNISNSKLNLQGNNHQGEVSVKGNSSIHNKEQNDIYQMLKQLFLNICDSNGFIIYKDFSSLCGELSLVYSIESYMNQLLTEIKKIAKSSLLPGKFHIKDATKILKYPQYEQMYNQIISKLHNNPNLVDSISFSRKSVQINKTSKPNTSRNSRTDIQIEKRTNNTTNRNYEILNTLITKTPLLSKVKDAESGYKITEKKSNKKKTENSLKQSKCFNFLYQSNSELQVSPNYNSKIFMKNFLYFINHVSFPLKYSDTNQSFIISISSYEKEYKFLKSFLHNVKIDNFSLEKWFCYEYYNQIFHNYQSSDYLFEHSIMFFYSYYNEIVDNFFNDIYQINECYLMIEENPSNLIMKNQKETKIVMYALVQKSSNDGSNSIIDNLVYNQQDDKFYFKNPFDWIGSSTIAKKSTADDLNILIPIYIITFYN